MQLKMFRDAFKDAGMDITKELMPIDIRDMNTQDAVKKVEKALEEMGVE